MKNDASRKKLIAKTGVYPKSNVDFGRLYSDFISKLSPNTGCATFFLGVARRESADGSKEIKALVMESYEEHANKTLRKICDEVKKKFYLNEIMIVHALGRFVPGEPIVFVALSAPRRDVAFKALRESVERYKKEPALFKQEIYSDGSSEWIE
jgi:molybdopterin synthase catalytic subunit